MDSANALIIFAKLPRPGRVKTRLGAALGMERAAGIYREFAGHALSLAGELRKEGVRVHLFHDPEAETDEVRRWVERPFVYARQHGESLGDRMRNAFAETFEAGASRSVVIGTDVPELELSGIRQAFLLLEDHDVVLGPSTDGGYYLLGMNAPLKDVFEGIRWSTETVYDETIRRLDRLRLLHVSLEKLSDVDTWSDYQSYLARTGKQ